MCFLLLLDENPRLCLGFSSNKKTRRKRYDACDELVRVAEYHQKNFSDPLMILRMVRVAGVEPTASWTRTMRATNCATPGYSLIIIRNFFEPVKVIFSEMLT